MTKEPVEIARAGYEAYVQKDRAAIEALIADDFHFTALRTLGTVRTMSASRRRPTSRFQPGMAAM